MTVTELKNSIRSGNIAPLLIFCGDEDYLKRFYLSEIRKRIITDEVFAPFNHMKFDGEKVNFGQLSDAAKAPPMMSERKLIEWHYPDFGSMKEKDFDAMSALHAELAGCEHTVLVFLCGETGLDIGRPPSRPSKIYERLSKCADIVSFERSDDAKLIKWICAHFEKENTSVSAAVAQTLINVCGHSMEILAREIDKLVCYVKANGRDTLDEETVYSVSSPNFEGDTFGLSNAILNKDKAAALADLRDKKLRKTDPTMTLASVSKVFCDLLAVSCMLSDGLTQSEIAKKLKMHEYKASLYIKSARSTERRILERALEVCRRTDLESKTAYRDGYLCLERLISEIFGEA